MSTIADRLNAAHFLPREIRLMLRREEGAWTIPDDFVFVSIFNASGGTILHRVSIPLQLTEAQKDTVLGILQTRLTEFAQNQNLTLLPE